MRLSPLNLACKLDHVSERNQECFHGGMLDDWCMWDMMLEWYCMKCWECIFEVLLQLIVKWHEFCAFSRRCFVEELDARPCSCMARPWVFVFPDACPCACPVHGQKMPMHARVFTYARPCMPFSEYFPENSSSRHGQAHDQRTTPCVQAYARALSLHARAPVDFQKKN